ncbi:putative sinapoylglucose--choline O-sinapoyltransferase [Helianthus annuus]|nr:putative sinapoylglucose--choline O-sinapoyltransferase [Helianthus annuus]
MFYYFVESQRNPQQDPLLLYLTGGPGTSAILPFFYQIGNCFHLNILILHYVFESHLTGEEKEKKMKI